MNISDLSQSAKDTYSRCCIQNKKKVKIEDVILSTDNKQKLDQFMVEHDNRKKFACIAPPVNRILMYGASGTGKTYLTTAIACHYDLPLLQVDVSKFQASAVAQIFTDVFNLTKELKEAVIFLDECDSICWARDDLSGKNRDDVRVANNTLFQLLDNMSSDCIFVGATNLYENLDPAFVRRFNVKMKFLPPKIDNLDNAINKFLNVAFEIEDDMDPEVEKIINYQVRNYDRLSYYQIEDWVQRAEKAALLENSTVIKKSDIYGMLMSELRISVKYDKDNKPYLHQYGVQSV